MKRSITGLLLIALCCGPTWPAQLLTVNKTVFESFNLSADFTAVVGADGVRLVGVKAFTLNGTDVSSTLIATNPAPSVMADVVTFRVQGGSPSTNYTLAVYIADSVNGQQYEGTFTLNVAATP